MSGLRKDVWRYCFFRFTIFRRKLIAEVVRKILIHFCLVLSTHHFRKKSVKIAGHVMKKNVQSVKQKAKRFGFYLILIVCLKRVPSSA